MSETPHKPPDQTPVLLVEDEPRLRDVLVTAIHEMGHPAVGVSNGEAAVRMMSERPFDIVILDLNLPGIDGMQLFDEIRRRWPNTEVIVITGYGDLNAARRAIRLNVVDFLTKPVPLGELELALHRAWRRRNETLGRAHLESSMHAVTTAEMAGLLKADHTPSDEDVSLEELERRHILAALKRNNGKREPAAAELGISLRTLYNKLAQYERMGLSEDDQ